jgi:hypothetical protein
MPAMQTMLTKLNQLSSDEQLRELDPRLFAPEARLSDAVRELGIDDGGLARYLDELPIGIHEAIRAVVHSALLRESRQPMTFAWAPGYDYELSVWDVSATKETAGGITVLLRSRYPADTHPLSAS